MKSPTPNESNDTNTCIGEFTMESYITGCLIQIQYNTGMFLNWKNHSRASLIWSHRRKAAYLKWWSWTEYLEVFHVSRRVSQFLFSQLTCKHLDTELGRNWENLSANITILSQWSRPFNWKEIYWFKEQINQWHAVHVLMIEECKYHV